MGKTKISASLSNVSMSAENNKMIISGCITKIGEPSTEAPCGTNGKRAVFTKESVDACMQSFVGMPLNCTYPDGFFADGTELFTGHGEKNIGYIREVHADGDKLMAEMVVWKDRFPDEAYMILNGVDALGFSVEWYATKTHEDEDYIYMDEFEGCGCAILWQNCAAFEDTFIEHLAAARENRSDVKVEKEALVKEISTAVLASVEERMKNVEEMQEKIKASIDGLSENTAAQVEEKLAGVSKDYEALKADVDAIKAEAEKAKAEAEKAKDEAEEQKKAIEASKSKAKAEDDVIPAPKAGQHIEENPMMAADSKEAEIEKINASSKMSPMDKIKAITKLRSQKND